jgi:hypothetical protein
MSHPAEQSIVKKAIQDAVSPVLESRVHNVEGVITKYHKENHLANVSFYANGAQIVRTNVPFFKQKAIVDATTFREGDRVWISFKGGSLQDPFIISKYEPDWVDTNDKNVHAEYAEIVTYL